MLAFILQCADAVRASVLANLPSLGVLAAAFTALGLLSSACNPGPPWWRKPDLALDLVYWMVLPLVSSFARVGFLSGGAALVVGGWDAGRVESFFAHGAGPLSALPFWGQVGAYLILSDLMMYGTHRAFHSAALWRYHAVHHAPEHLEWTSANRFHPVNVALHGVLADCVLLLLGIAPEVLVHLVPVSVGMSALVHANLDWTFGPFRYVLASPVFHRWHHTDVGRGGARNFAPTFPLMTSCSARSTCRKASCRTATGSTMSPSRAGSRRSSSIRSAPRARARDPPMRRARRRPATVTSDRAGRRRGRGRARRDAGPRRRSRARSRARGATRTARRRPRAPRPTGTGRRPG